MSGKYSDDEYEYESGGSGFDDDDDDGGYTYESDDDADDGDFEMKMPHRSGDSYTVYNLDEIAARQEQVATELSDVLALTPSQCSTILRHYKWNPQAVKARWFDGEEESIRATVGLSVDVEEPMTPADQSAEVECQACMCDVPAAEVRALRCGHTFCNDCWREYLTMRVGDGLGSVFTRCMDECQEAVPDAWFAELLPSDLAEKYRKFVLFSFVEHNQYCRWCSRPGCEHAVEYPPGGMRDIECRCGNLFCFACGMEPHRPAACELVKQWMDKNSAESENVTWIIANTKKCPQCHNPIEKNQGCNHMTCRKAARGCGHEFCWLCLGPWKDHGNATGGYYKCNKYEKDKQEGRTKSEETSRLKAKHALDKYIHYFDRYINHDRARKIALRSLDDIEAATAQLQTACGYKLSDVTFIREAAEQVIKCRQVLKYTYVHGYYLTNSTERHLFEHLQEMLEKNTDHLHGLVETPLTPYINKKPTPGLVPFFTHRSNVTNFTGITKKFLEEMMQGVEGGLTEAGRAGT